MDIIKLKLISNQNIINQYKQIDQKNSSIYKQELRFMSDQIIIQEYAKIQNRDEILSLRYKKLKENGSNWLCKWFSPKYRKLVNTQINACHRLNKNITKLNSLCSEIDWNRDKLIRKGNKVEYLSSLIDCAV